MNQPWEVELVRRSSIFPSELHDNKKKCVVVTIVTSSSRLVVYVWTKKFRHVKIFHCGLVSCKLLLSVYSGFWALLCDRIANAIRIIFVSVN